MIIFLSNEGYFFTHEKLKKSPGLPVIQCKSYEWALKKRTLPSATYVFTDRERMDNWQLRILSGLYQHINELGVGFRAINNPATMLDRSALLRRLYTEGVNPFNAYPVVERQLPERYPVFVRRTYDHRVPVTDLIHSEIELIEQLQQLQEAGEPEEGLLIIEYCSEPVAENLFRKLAAYKIADHVFFHNTGHEDTWLVKYGKHNSGNQALYEEERSFIESNAFSETLRKAFDLAGIDYGRMDFGLVDGKPVVYEINTNPQITPPGKPHSNALREENLKISWEHYGHYLSKIDMKYHKSRKVKKFKHPGLRLKWLKRLFNEGVLIRR